MDKSVIITGATGFIGRHCVVSARRAGYEVHAVSSRECPPRTSAGVIWHQADLLEVGAARTLSTEVHATHLLHAAWIAKPGAFWTSEDNLRWVVSSIELFREFFANGGKRVLGVGTCAEYARTAQDCREDVTPLGPNTIYGRAKLAVSLALEAAAAVAAGSAAWARLFFPYGPGEPPERLIPSVIRGVLAGRKVECSHGRQVRDFIYVEDVADALLAILSSDATGPFNVATGCALTLREVVAVICGKIGGAELIEFDARPAPACDPGRVVGDPSRLARELGWQPAYSIDAGIERAIAAWRSAPH